MQIRCPLPICSVKYLPLRVITTKRFKHLQMKWCARLKVIMFTVSKLEISARTPNSWLLLRVMILPCSVAILRVSSSPSFQFAFLPYFFTLKTKFEFFHIGHVITSLFVCEWEHIFPNIIFQKHEYFGVCMYLCPKVLIRLPRQLIIMWTPLTHHYFLQVEMLWMN